MITLENLSKSYKDNLVLDHITYTFPSTGITCILGPSGSGKTSLINLIAGFDTDYNGTIKVSGTSISDLSPHDLCNYRRNNVGYIFQNYNLLTGYTVLENIMLASDLNTYSDFDNHAYALDLLDAFNMQEKINEKIENLSGGQKQRVAIARALINRPNLILADEPTGALDEQSSLEIMDILTKLSKDKLVIIITHHEALTSFSQESLVIKKKKLKILNKNTCDLPQAPSYHSRPAKKINNLTRAYKNFKVHFKKYCLTSIFLALALVFSILAYNANQAMDRSIEAFKDDHSAFNKGYIPSKTSAPLLGLLTEHSSISKAYAKYILRDVQVVYDQKTVDISEKYPLAKATANFAYGRMASDAAREIAISPSLAKKLSPEIYTLIGQTLTLNYKNESYNLIISGIFDHVYDDFYLSHPIEEMLYEGAPSEDLYAISYHVNTFEDIESVHLWLDQLGYPPQTALKQVQAFTASFKSLEKTFLFLCIFVVCIGLLMAFILLVKHANSRYKEVGLLSALGYSKKNIRSILTFEHLCLTLMTLILYNILLGGMILGARLMSETSMLWDLTTNLVFMCLSTLIVSTISFLTSYKLIKTEAAIALRK